MDPVRMQDPGPDQLDGSDMELYMSISRTLREEAFDYINFSREKMERVYDLLNTCDPMFYLPAFNNDNAIIYSYDPMTEYTAVYRNFLMRIYGDAEMDDSDMAASMGRNVDMIARLYEDDFRTMLRPCCVAKGIQYSCNIFGIRCTLINGKDGAMYAVSELEEDRTDEFGIARTERVLDEIVGAVAGYLNEREYQYDVLNTTFMDRLVQVKNEGVAYRFRYLAYTDMCIVRVIMHRSLRERYEKDFLILDTEDRRNIYWEKGFSMKDGIPALMKGIDPFLPEGGMPEEVTAQLNVLRKIVNAAEKAYDDEDTEQLNRLIEMAGDENEKLDDLCEKTGFPYEYVGAVPYRLYELLDEMGLFGDDEDVDEMFDDDEDVSIADVLKAPFLDPEEIVFGGTKIYSTEMEKLISMLDEAGIPYSMRNGLLGGKMLDYYGREPGEHSKLNVISDGYGYEDGLLEAQGLGWDSWGGLTAAEVFERISQDYNKET